MQLEIYRAGEVVNTIDVGEEAIYKEALMADHQIEVPGIVSLEPLDLQLDDYIIYKGVKFKINTVPDVVVEFDYTYTIIFEGPKFTWHDKLFMDEGSNEFTYYGNAYDLMLLFLLNVNEIDPGWSLGSIEATTEQHIPFTGGDAGLFCYEAIKQISEAFKLEYSIDGKVISVVKKVGRDTGLSFEYGMGKGLFDLKRSYVNEKNVITKAYGFGGTKNLPIGYGKPRLTYDPGFATHNTELYKIKEGKYVNDDIYPHREALATAVTFGDNIYTLTDTTLDFDINALKVEKLDPKIFFLDGELGGEEFKITNYNVSTKTITYEGFINNNNIHLPGSTAKAKVGDKYTLVDLNMPDSYITAAKAQVQSETETFVLENSVPQLEYSGTADPLHLRENSIDLRPGDRVYFKDTKMGFNDSIRITEISYPITFPDLFTNDTRVNITVGNFVSYTTQQRLKADVLQVKNEIQVVDIRRAEAARRNSANLFNLRDLVIDPTTEKYYTGKIAAGSIETLYLAVGAKATNFSLKNVSFNTNAGGNPNVFTATAGQLIHYDLKIEGAGFVWEMQPFNTSALVSANTYYLYAKVSRNSLVGSWIVSTEMIAVESVTGFWHLQAGVLFPVKDGRRDYELTKGMSFIIGDQITAGVLKSLDGLNFFNLTDGKFNLGDGNFGLDWNVSTPNRLTIRGGITQNAGGVTAPIPVFRGSYGNTTTYYKGDTVTYNGSTWAYIYATPIFNVTPVEGAYWTVVAQKGSDGAAGGIGQSVTIEYSVNGTTNWHSIFAAGDIFMRQRVGAGAWSNAIRIVGENGAAGIDGKYTDYQFAKNTSLITAPTSGFTDEPPAVGIGEYLWLRTGEFNANGSQIGTWSTPVRISGPQGEPGVPGIPGADGSTLYTWVKYADNAAGSGMSDYPTGKIYIGLAYNKTIPSESINPNDYTWALFKGEGVPGVPGADGITLYTWVKYADSPTSGMSDDPTGKKYLGLAYNKTSPIESTDYADYLWSLIKGSDGANGANGQDGNYTEFRFAKNGSTTSAPALSNANPNPLGWSISQPSLAVAEYMWVTSAVKTAAGALVSNWTSPTRLTGVDGADGRQGPFLTYKGDYVNSKEYFGSADRIEGVRYLGNWYVTRVDAGSITGILPTNTVKWNPYGGQFESVATDLLLATLAYIENLGVRNLSTAPVNNKRVVLDAVQNNIRILNDLNKVLIELDDDSAIEKSTYNSNTGETENVMGPGIIVGQNLKQSGVILVPDDYASMSRKGISTSGFLGFSAAYLVPPKYITSDEIISNVYKIKSTDYFIYMSEGLTGVQLGQTYYLDMSDLSSSFRNYALGQTIKIFNDVKSGVIIKFRYNDGTIVGDKFRGLGTPGSSTHVGYFSEKTLPAYTTFTIMNTGHGWVEINY